jgi:HK97 gp10 family phage protein
MSVKIIWNGDDVMKRAEEAAKLSSFELGLVVQGQAKMLAPVDQGRLRASITTASGAGQRTKPSGKGAVGTDLINKPSDQFETFVGTPVFYGPYIEYGTVRANAQPFLRPALDMIKGRKLTVFDEVLKNGNVRKAFGEYLQ